MPKNCLAVFKKSTPARKKSINNETRFDFYGQDVQPSGSQDASLPRNFASSSEKFTSDKKNPFKRLGVARKKIGTPLVSPIELIMKGGIYRPEAAENANKILKEHWDMSLLSSPEAFNADNFKFMVHTIPIKSFFASYGEEIDDANHQKRKNYLERLIDNPESTLQEKEYLSASIISNDNPNTYASLGFIIQVPKQNILIACNHDINFENNKGDLRYPELQHGYNNIVYESQAARNAAIMQQISGKMDPLMPMKDMFSKAQSSDNGDYNEIIFTPKAGVYIHPGLPLSQSVKVAGAFIIEPNNAPPVAAALSKDYNEGDVNLEEAQKSFISKLKNKHPKLPILNIKGSGNYR